ncbi:hypothetical protein IG631_17999 [Alternaria alternata]|nr:hypothetical protein IG631_17999 [Alternaria alternata]
MAKVQGRVSISSCKSLGGKLHPNVRTGFVQFMKQNLLLRPTSRRRVSGKEPRDQERGTAVRLGFCSV